MKTSRTARTATVAAALLLLATGCAGEETDDAPGDAAGGVSYDADDVVLQVEYTGGFTTATMLLTRLPAVTVYGDGRVITEGPQIMIYPGPAMPNLQVQRISPEDVQALADRALDAGVGAGLDFGQPPIADATTTRFTVLTQVGPQTSEVYALEHPDGEAADLTEDQRAARTAMWELFTALTDLPGTLGAEAVSEAEPYQATAVAAVAEPWQPLDEGLGDQPEVSWPGPELPGEPINDDLGLPCLTVTGADAEAVLAAAAEANLETPWESGDERWRVTLRPLLPGETGCADLL